MRCSKCGSDNRDGANFCHVCGTAPGSKCATCGALNQPGANFCDKCGAALTGSVTTNAEGVTRVFALSGADSKEAKALLDELRA
jgi:uncharacterized OB-fold protein